MATAHAIWWWLIGEWAWLTFGVGIVPATVNGRSSLVVVRKRHDGSLCAWRW